MSIRIHKEGILTTLQGLGEYGMQRFGINPRGAMDKTAVRLINVLLGNPENEPAVEMHFPAGEIVFEQNCMFALGGADFNATLDGEVLEYWSSAAAKNSSVLKFGRKIKGHRCYLAVEGGFKTEPDTLHFHDVRLKKEFRLEFNSDPSENLVGAGRRISNGLIPIYSSFPTVRILAGAQFDLLANTDRKMLVEDTFLISNDSNRMGFRLNGPEIRSAGPAEMVSSAVTFATIQLLPDGQLIILMADHQTSGGYPRIANVITADQSLLGQLGANDKVAFKLVDIEEAERATLQTELDIRRLRVGCRFGRYW